MIEPTLIVELLLLGTGTGFLAGLLGIGGGMIMVPFITYILTHRGVPDSLAVKMAIATSMATIIFTSLSSVRAHHKRGTVLWPLVMRLAPGIVLGSAIASLGAFSVVKGQSLALVFAVFVGFSAFQMLRNVKPSPSRDLPGPVGQIGAGGVMGFLSGLVGAGGAFISVPYMTWCNVTMHNAISTAAALGFPIALANVLGYIYSGWSEQNLPEGAFGYIFVPALVVIASASVLVAPLGVRAAHALPVVKLKRIFSGLLFCLAAYMLSKAF